MFDQSLKFNVNSVLSLSIGFYLSICPFLLSLDSSVNNFSNSKLSYLFVFFFASILANASAELLNLHSSSWVFPGKKIPVCKICYITPLLRTLCWLLSSLWLKSNFHHLYAKPKKKKKHMNLYKNRHRLTDIENKCFVTKRESREGIN